MGLWSYLSGNKRKQHAVVHDFTFVADCHRISQVKQLGNDRVFMVGFSPDPHEGDVVIVRGENALSPHVRYRLETMKRFGNEWRAYAQVEHLAPSVVRSHYGKRAEIGRTR